MASDMHAAQKGVKFLCFYYASIAEFIEPGHA